MSFAVGPWPAAFTVLRVLCGQPLPASLLDPLPPGVCVRRPFSCVSLHPPTPVVEVLPALGLLFQPI